MPFLIGIIIFIGFVIFCYFFVKNKIRNFVRSYFGTNSLCEFAEKAKIAVEETPKSISGMDSIYGNQIMLDFPYLNIDELKGKTKQIILDCFFAIEKKDSTLLKNEKLKRIIERKIEDVKHCNVYYEKIKFHNTVISSYNKNKFVATICFATNFEYYYHKDDTVEKVQDRAKVEFIYVIDEEHLSNRAISLGIHCPNCGSPIKSLKEKNCEYCGTAIVDITNRVWVCNHIEWY